MIDCIINGRILISVGTSTTDADPFGHPQRLKSSERRGSCGLWNLCCRPPESFIPLFLVACADKSGPLLIFPPLYDRSHDRISFQWRFQDRLRVVLNPHRFSFQLYRCIWWKFKLQLLGRPGHRDEVQHTCFILKTNLLQEYLSSFIVVMTRWCFSASIN